MALSFLSCLSLLPPQPLFLDLMLPEGEGRGEISSVLIREDGFALEGRAADFPLALRLTGGIPPEVLDAVRSARFYEFRKMTRPDGPVETLILSDEAGLLLYLADRAPSGRLWGLGPEWRMESAGEEELHLEGPSGDGRLIAGRPRELPLAETASYRGWLLNLQRGELSDQPLLAADLILLRL